MGIYSDNLVHYFAVVELSLQMPVDIIYKEIQKHCTYTLTVTAERFESPEE